MKQIIRLTTPVPFPEAGRMAYLYETETYVIRDASALKRYYEARGLMNHVEVLQDDLNRAI